MLRSPWVFEQDTGRYRNTETGKFIGPKDMLALRDQFTAAMREKAAGLADRMRNDRQAVGPWLGEMRALLKQVFTDQYVLAKGGRNRMEQADWGRLGYMIRHQFDYLQGMAEEAVAGKLTGPQLAARAEMYVEAGTAAYQKARAGKLRLPAYPADGTTQCLSRCKCHWTVTELENHYEATWELGAADHCEDCEQRATQWSPLILRK